MINTDIFNAKEGDLIYCPLSGGKGKIVAFENGKETIQIEWNSGFIQTVEKYVYYQVDPWLSCVCVSTEEELLLWVLKSE